MKVKILSRLQVPKDREKKAAPLFDELAKRIVQQPGYVMVEILRKRNQPTVFLFLSTWASFRDWERWFASEDRKAITEKLGVTEESDIEVFDYDFLADPR